MGQMTLSLSTEAEAKLREDAKKNLRTISAQVEFMLNREDKDE